MLDINIKVDMKDVDKLLPDIKEGILKGMKLATLYAEGQAKKLGFAGRPYLNVGTGHLRRSIIGTVKQEGDEYIGSVGSDVIYANILHEGGTIRAKNVPYLKFKLPNGQWVSKKSVTIPSRKYIEDPIRNNIDRIRDIIIDSITKEVNNGN